MGRKQKRRTATELIKYPTRVLVVGKSKSGKTTWVVKRIKKSYKKFDRIIVACPTFLVQPVFEPLRRSKKIMSKIKPEDIYLNINDSTFKKISRDIESNVNKHKNIGLKAQRVLILVDDVAGNSAIHNNRKGTFANFSVQVNHWNTSMFVISQQPSCVDPNFRNNAEIIVVFPSEGIDDVSWLKRAYQSLAMTNIQMSEIISLAWSGAKQNFSEWGKHFLFIVAEPRTHTRFFIDCNKEINIIDG